MGSDLAYVPAWVAPPSRQVADLHAIAAAVSKDGRELARGTVDALDWVTDPHGPTARQAQAEAASTAKVRDDYHRGISDTLAWLNGWATHPPLALPRRNPDGSVVTWQQLYREREQAAPLRWEPEQAEAAEAAARKQAARWQALADLAG